MVIICFHQHGSIMLFTSGKQLYLLFFCVMLVSCLIGCAPNVKDEGYIPNPKAVDSVKPGIDSRNSILKKLGSPSSISSFDSNIWFYIGKRSQSKPFFYRETLEQQVFTITFGRSGVVKTIEHYKLKDAQPVKPASGATPSLGHKLGFLEQLFGNLGRRGRFEAGS